MELHLPLLEIVVVENEFLNINCLPSELNLMSKTMWQSVGEMEHNEHYIGNALFLVVFVADDFFPINLYRI